MSKKVILDACCSGRMFWFDKTNPNCLYCDIREIPKGTVKNAPNFSIEPDKVMDFKNMDLPDKSFKLIVFDPPHLKSLEKNSWVALKYGTLDSETWKADILAGFNECWRVLDDYGTLIFKWSKSNDNRRRRDVSIENILKLLPVRPLFGHPSGSKINTIWMCFMKIPKCGDHRADLNVQGAPCSPAGVRSQDKNFIELFCGFGSVTEEFKEAGFNTWKTDIRKRKGICEPDLKINIMELSSSKIPFKKVHVLWASPPCDVWSYAAGNFHWNSDGTPKTKKCQDHINILEKTQELIEEISPDIFFIENPRGRLRSYAPFLEWLKRMGGETKVLTYGSYGCDFTKPTNIFTNAKEIQFKELAPFGRGAKLNCKMDNISKNQKAKIPKELAKELVGFCSEKSPGHF